MQVVSTLLQLCLDAVARALPLDPPPTPATLPDEVLTRQIYDIYVRMDQARRRASPNYSHAKHLAVLRQFAAFWQPSVLVVTAPSAPGQPDMALCGELSAVRDSLAHLELATTTAAAWLSGLQGLTSLSCLSLRGCSNLAAAAVQQVLQQLPQLTSLDLSGLASVSDALAPTLVSLTNLVVLQLNHTNCSDTTVEWLTYGWRLHQWSSAAGQQYTARQQLAGAGAASPLASTSTATHPTQQWPRTKIRSWHLAYTRVTARVVELVGICPDILLLDLRGSGVKAAQLAPLRARFALSAVQGAVLSRTAAMVLAVVTLEQFVCADAVQHGPAAAAVRVEAAAAGRQSAAGSSHSSLQWVNQGVAALLQAAADAAGLPFPLQQHPGS